MRVFTPLSLLALALVACQGQAAGTDSDSGTGTTEGSTTDVSSTTGTSEPALTTGSSTEPTTGAAEGCEPGCGPDEACIAGSCEAVGRAEIEAGCHPLGEPGGRVQCVYPWPSDFYTVADPESPTGRVVALPAALLPKNKAGDLFAADELVNGWPGFSANAQIRFSTGQAVDKAGLPPIDDIARSLAEDSPTVLVATSTGERWPHFAEVDARAEAGEPKTIFIRPMRRLRAGERYVVAIRGLKTEGGGEFAPSPLFRALRDDLPTDVPQLEGERARYAEIFAALEEAGIARESLQLAWDFTVNDDATLQRDFEAIAPQIEAAVKDGDLGYVIEKVEENPDAAVALVVRGRFTVPNCLEGDGATGSVFSRDPQGLPECSGQAEAPFWVAVPKSVYDAGVPVPAALWGHGLLGTGESATSVATKTGAVVLIGTDIWGLAEEDIPTLFTLFGG
ncbi:MAG TPA: hypothetical protein VIK91_28015, partial [Nannocystis sp.]